MSTGLDVPHPLQSNAAALLLSLADYETNVWLDPPLRDAADVVAFVKFHTGAHLVEEKCDADFAVVADVRALPPIAEFKQGTLEFPDRSTTLIIQVERFEEAGPTFSGPGIETTVRFIPAPAPAEFVTQCRVNRQLFPRGVDMLFVTPEAIAGLPRSSVIKREG